MSISCHWLLVGDVVQGTLLKRHLISKRPGPDGRVEYFGWQDLYVGNELTFYGRCVWLWPFAWDAIAPPAVIPGVGVCAARF